MFAPGIHQVGSVVACRWAARERRCPNNHGTYKEAGCSRSPRPPSDSRPWPAHPPWRRFSSPVGLRLCRLFTPQCRLRVSLLRQSVPPARTRRMAYPADEGDGRRLGTGGGRRSGAVRQLQWRFLRTQSRGRSPRKWFTRWWPDWLQLAARCRAAEEAARGECREIASQTSLRRSP